MTATLLGSLVAQSATLRVDPTVVREVDRHRFLGTNVGLFYKAREAFDADIQYYLRELNPTFLRIPGGSWASRYIWNGNGVFDGKDIDMSKLVDGTWQIDYSEYQPGFCLESVDGKPYHWHGDLDVYALHEFVKDKGAQQIVTVNVGTGTAEMAAEWVRWANLKMGYGVRYWEIGNELEGSWEIGHIRPDGSKMTGELYAQKFIEYAKAMKAVDPTIEVGGPTTASTRAEFLEPLLRDAGDYVDFVSIHTYPVEGHLDSAEDIIKQAFSLKEPMQRYQKLIERYQPDRKDEIEIAITEWNTKVHEGRTTGDLLNGLWNAAFVGEMIRNNVDFATHWDLLTVTEEGGHGMFQFVGHCMPKSQYWGLYMWSKYMGNQLVDTELDGLGNAYAFVTRDDERFYVMVINVSRNEKADIRLDIPGVQFSGKGRMATLSHREYFWDLYAHQPKWSRKPHEKAFDFSDDLIVPPYSVRVFELPMKGFGFRSDSETENAKDSPLEILLPKKAPVGVPIEGWILLQNDPEDPKVKNQIFNAGVSVAGPAKLDVNTVSLAEAAGRFYLTPSGAGTVTVSVEAGGAVVEQQIDIEAIHERIEIVWQFEDETENWNARSSYKLVGDDTVRPNQQVAAVVVDGEHPTSGNNELAVFSLPETVDKKRIAGVVFDVSTSTDFECSDESIGIRVVLQSDRDHWIVLGSLTLEEVRGKWKTLELKLPDPKYYKAMGSTYALHFQLYQNAEETVPVSGRVFLDDVGFILR